MHLHRRKRARLERLEPRVLLAVDTLVITEFLANNDTVLVDEDGDFSDWIEVHNPTDADVSLTGWSLTDQSDDLSKWAFPDVTIPAGGYELVFASGKDRRNVGGELHTSFRLSADGEYLALVDPQGGVRDFGDAYPPQRSDTSFGLSFEQDSFVGSDAESRILVPASSDAGQAWTDPEFDDSRWQQVLGTIGYDLRRGLPNVGFEERGFDQWETTGPSVVMGRQVGVEPTQGTRHALLTANEASPSRLSIELFLGLERSELDNLGNGFAALGTAVRREITVAAGETIQFDWNLLTDEPRLNGSNDFAFVSITPGPGAMELADASDAEQLSSSRFSRETNYRTFTHTFEEAGTFRLGVGVMNQGNRFINSALLIDNLLINGVGSLADTFGSVIDTNIESDLAGVDASLWVRSAFEVEDPASFSSLLLNARYSDGMVAYLNGLPIARRNAPADLTWNALATATREDTDALRFESFLTPADLLRSGTNVLAWHVLKHHVDDENLLLHGELVGIGQIDEIPVYHSTPTPRLPNLTDSFSVVDQVQFSVEHGFYDEPFQLELTTATPGATIRYTLDGSVPTIDTGQVYEAPIAIDGSQVVRAAAFKIDVEPSPVSTRSFLFIEDVLTQNRTSALARGFPSQWGQRVVDYDMDRRVIGQNGTDRFGGRYANSVRDDLRSVPTLSIVMDLDDLFGTEGIYSNPFGRGVEWERPTSVELIDPHGGAGFQIDAGIRMQGGISRVISDKNSLRLLFKDEYGSATLDYPLFGEENARQFDSVSLRSSTGEHLVGIHYIRDEFLRRSQLKTGNVSSHGTYMHLYINGLYWGMYNPVERIDSQFAENYFGGDKDEYDVLNAGDLGREGVSVVDGSLEAWNTMIGLAKEVSSAVNSQDRTAAYLRLQGLNPDGTRNEDGEVFLDTQNFIDYLITNVYARNTDWPIRNYYMLRRRGPDSTGFKFFVWDAEFTLDQGSRDSISTISSDGPGIVFRELLSSEAFRVDFSDRVQQHFSPGGAFYVNPLNRTYDPANPQDNVPAALYAELAASIESPLVPETARWGDERGRSGALFTRDEQWRRTVDANLAVFFRNRSRVLLDDLRRNDFYRPAPDFSVNPGPINAGQNVQIRGSSGTIYFTIDGSDPRNPDGSIAPQARIYEGPIEIHERTTLKTRSLDDARWSAVNEVTYFTDAVPADSTNLRISELNYNPHGPLTDLGELDVDNDEFEFVEIVNVGPRPIELEGVEFVLDNGQGIGFVFAAQVLAPQEHLAVPKNRAAFQTRFGTDVALARGLGDDANHWIYEGRLGNGGERVTLVSAEGDPIQSLDYRDDQAWPGRADGNGSSLEIVDVDGDPDDPANYRSSSEFGGSPGRFGLGPDNRILINEVLANPVRPGVDQIELFNRSTSSLEIGGWYLSDSNDDYRRYVIPAGTRIEPGDYLVFDETQFGFGLNSVRGDDVFLLQADDLGRPARFVDRVEFGSSEVGVSLGRWPNGGGGLFRMSSPTLGAANSGPMLDRIIISEIHYHPQDPDDNGSLIESDVEFVEIYNRSGETVNLAGYHLDGDVKFDFPEGLLLGPGQAVVAVAMDPAADPRNDSLLRLIYQIDPSVPIVGPVLGELNNEAGVVRIRRDLSPTPGDNEIPSVIVDQVSYENRLPWPDNLNDTGQSLNRVSRDVFGGRSYAWIADRRSPGRSDFTAFSPGDVTRDGQIDVSDVDRLCAALHEAPDPRFDLNQDGRLDHADFGHLLDQIIRTRPGDANLDGLFNSTDLVMIFRAAEFEDDQPRNSTWAEGDWNCDQDFTSSDLVAALRIGEYSTSSRPLPRVAAGVSDLTATAAHAPANQPTRVHVPRSERVSERRVRWLTPAAQLKAIFAHQDERVPEPPQMERFDGVHDPERQVEKDV